MNHVGNQMMLLEPSTTLNSNNPEQREDKNNATKFKVTGKFDPLKKSTCPAPITVQNKYSALEDENDDDDSENEDTDDCAHKRRQRTHNPTTSAGGACGNKRRELGR